MDNIYKRLSRVESMAELEKSNLVESLKKSYESAKASGDIEDIARAARALRDKLLDSSDAEMALDRLSLDTSSPIKFIASLTKIFNGDWAKYRQQLRDIPQQKGFPNDIIFPKSPKELEDELVHMGEKL